MLNYLQAVQGAPSYLQAMQGAPATHRLCIMVQLSSCHELLLPMLGWAFGDIAVLKLFLLL